MPKSGGKKLFVSKCGSKCGVKTLRRQNVASGTNVVAPPKWWKCGFKQCGVEMWRQAQIWWRLRKWPKCGVKQCGVRHKCGGSPKCGVKQCGVKMWRQAQMWWQSEMWRQTTWRQNVASDTPFAKLSSRKCVFKKGIQWQAQKCYTKCLCPGKYDNIKIALKQSILPDTAIELIRHFDDDTLGAICEGVDYEGLEWEIMNFEDKVKRENRRMKTLDVFFLLYDIPKVKDIEKKFGYNNNLSSFLHSKLNFLKKWTRV